MASSDNTPKMSKYRSGNISLSDLQMKQFFYLSIKGIEKKHLDEIGICQDQRFAFKSNLYKLAKTQNQGLDKSNTSMVLDNKNCI